MAMRLSFSVTFGGYCSWEVERVWKVSQPATIKIQDGSHLARGLLVWCSSEFSGWYCHRYHAQVYWYYVWNAIIIQGILPKLSTFVIYFSLPYRIVFAVATEDSVVFYDTQQQQPFGYISNVHYHQLSDLAW